MNIAIATASASAGSIHHDRAWWAAEAAANRSDWNGILETHVAVLAQLGIIERGPSSFEVAWAQADRKRGADDGDLSSCREGRDALTDRHIARGCGGAPMDPASADNVLDMTVRKSVVRRFKLFAELEATSTKQWLIHNLLGDGEASVMYGKPGDGKSVLAEDAALHVGAGRSWHGRKVKQGAVLFIALERKMLVERRAIAFRERHRLDDHDLPVAFVGGVYDLRQPRNVLAIVEIVREVEAATGQKLALIVIDTLSRALCGGDENSPKDMGAIVNTTGRLQAKTAAHVLWIHHMPLEGGERLRGHGALLGALDTTIHVAKAPDGTRIASFDKANDSEEGESLSFTLESVVIGEDADGNVTTAPVVVPVEGAPRRTAPKSSRPLPKAAQTALRALAEAIDEQGGPAPASNHVPPSVKVVTVSTWRQQSYRRGISTSDEERAKQQAFKRASEYLIGSGRVAAWDGHVWLAN